VIDISIFVISMDSFLIVLILILITFAYAVAGFASKGIEFDAFNGDFLLFFGVHGLA